MSGILFRGRACPWMLTHRRMLEKRMSEARALARTQKGKKRLDFTCAITPLETRQTSPPKFQHERSSFMSCCRKPTERKMLTVISSSVCPQIDNSFHYYYQNIPLIYVLFISFNTDCINIFHGSA